jgi:hypothetical protein
MTPAMVARLPSTISAQVVVLSQPGLTAAVAVRLRPGRALGLMMTRL